jgi:hypothetical protein
LTVLHEHDRVHREKKACFDDAGDCADRTVQRGRVGQRADLAIEHVVAVVGEHDRSVRAAQFGLQPYVGEIVDAADDDEYEDDDEDEDQDDDESDDDDDDDETEDEDDDNYDEDSDTDDEEEGDEESEDDDIDDTADEQDEAEALRVDAAAGSGKRKPKRISAANSSADTAEPSLRMHSTVRRERRNLLRPRD